MDLYQKTRQKQRSNISIIAEKVGVSEDYVRKILSGLRNGTKHKNSKGAKIIELAEQLTKEG